MESSHFFKRSLQSDLAINNHKYLLHEAKFGVMSIKLIKKHLHRAVLTTQSSQTKVLIVYSGRSPGYAHAIIQQSSAQQSKGGDLGLN